MITLSKRATLLGLAAFGMIGAARAQTQYAVGQVWRIRDVSNGRATIGLIEPFGDDVALHISIEADTPARFIPLIGPRTVLAHAPIAQAAFASSVDVMEATDASPAPNFQEGYSEWRSAMERGDAGIFTISVAEIVTYTGELLSRVHKR